MEYLSESSLWQSSLGQENQEYKNQRNILVAAYVEFRKNAEVLAGEIARDLPNFTVHDITHIESLWETGSLIVGEGYEINPMEAFVLGSAILLHDLGMASAAYIEGVDQLFEGKEWEDLLELSFRQELGRAPTSQERNAIPNNVLNNAKALRLRELHASHAEKLTSTIWKSKDGKSYRLLENEELLSHFSEYIGLIAASHGWSIEKVEEVFLNEEIGAPRSFPNKWSVDMLKLACILRVADAAHLDNRRAPGFLRALRKPDASSDSHWIFQQKLSRATIKEDQLIYTSIQKFTEKEIDAWWLAYDNLSMVDKELRDVNRLLKNRGRALFQAKAVKGIENPNKLAEYVKVINWEPVNANIHVSNVPHLVKQLGGEGLYGKSAIVPLRELIQNSRDAIHAAKNIPDYRRNDGAIVISIGNDSKGDWIEVLDNGIGMSQSTLCEKLLDFGSSYWGSYAMIKEHPGLLTSNFESIGKFGIGFYSLFMWGKSVIVKTRSIYEGPDETKILEFGSGLSGRPIIKKCNVREGLPEVGTSIRIYIDDLNLLLDTMISQLDVDEHIMSFEKEEKLASICRMIAPAIDVDINIKNVHNSLQNIIKADDWKSIDSISLILRLAGYSDSNYSSKVKKLAETQSVLLRPLIDEEGIQIGRAGIFVGPPYQSLKESINGVVTIGGLTSSTLHWIFGVLVGEVKSASRNTGKPIASQREINIWTAEQNRVIQENFKDNMLEWQNDAAELICGLSGEVYDLPICYTSKGWLNFSEVSKNNWPSTIAFINKFTLDGFIDLETIEPNVIAVNSGQRYVIGDADWVQQNRDNENDFRSLRNITIKALGESFGMNVEQLSEKGYFDFPDLTREMIKVGTTKEGNPIKYEVTVIDFSNSDKSKV